MKPVASSSKEGAIPLEIHAGGGRPLRDLRRTWGRKDIGPISKLVSSAQTAVGAPIVALSRADHYNPGAHSITSYHNSNAVKAHELGHAEDFARIHPKLQIPYAFSRTLPLATLYQEGTASTRGMRILRQAKGENALSEKELGSASRRLGAAFGSYVGAASGLGLPVIAAGHIGGKLRMFDQEFKKKNRQKK